jgi:hypothetical protein
VAQVTGFKGFSVALVLLALVASQLAAAQPAVQVEGEYQCDDCHGFLTVKRVSPTELQVWLGVGGGSCGGEAWINRKLRYTGGVLRSSYKQGAKQCQTNVEFTASGASVSDTCVTPKDEENSTCAMLGTYTRRTK